MNRGFGLKESKKERRNGKERALTSALGRTHSDAYSGRGGGGPKGRPYTAPLREAVSGALPILPALVLMQPLTKDLDHCVFLQDLSVQSPDPRGRMSRERRGNVNADRPSRKTLTAESIHCHASPHYNNSNHWLFLMNYLPVLHLLVPEVGGW